MWIWSYWIALAAGPLILLAAGLVYRLNRLRSFWVCFLWGWALQVILSLPAGLWQAVTSWGYSPSHFVPTKEDLLIPLLGWPFNAAGVSVRAFVLGLRSHWLNEPAVYFSAMIYQASVIALIFAWRYANRRTLRDPVIIVLAVLFLVNSLINVDWEWFPPS